MKFDSKRCGEGYNPGIPKLGVRIEAGNGVLI
jgi:hypothetical protein